jgi:hypothetical protein
MDKVIKINSSTAPPFTVNQNLVRFTFGSGDVLNLRDSVMNINVTIDVEGQAGAVYVPDLQWKSANAYKPIPQNVSFVRNAFLQCARKGMLESLSRIDLLKTNLHNYTKSQRELYSEGYLRCSMIQNPINGEENTIYRQINKTGTIKSRIAKSVPVQIRLGDMFDICNTPEFDTEKAGDLTLEAELNLDDFEVVQRYADQVGDAFLGEDDAVVGTKTQIVAQDKANSPSGIKNYVGQPVKIVATGNGGAGVVDIDVNIAGIEWNKSTNVWTYTFDRQWGVLTAGQSYTGIIVAPIAWTSASVEYDSAEIVMKTVAKPQGIDKIAFHTFSTQEDNANGLTNFQRQYQVEPESDNVMILFISADNRLNSTNTDIQSYRLRLNNENLTNEKVVIDSPLYYDRVHMLIDGMGHELRNLQQNSGTNKGAAAIPWADVYTQSEMKLLQVGNPLWASDRTKLLQVNITAGGGGVNQLVLFKTLPRVFEY